MNIFASSLADQSTLPIPHSLGPQQLVAATRYAINQKLIDEYIKSDSDLMRYKNSILEHAEIFQFDQVFGSAITQQNFYNYVCAPKINDCLNGVSSTFLVIGPQKSGKKYTVRGCEHEEKGISILAVQDILNLFEMHKQVKKKIQYQLVLFSPYISSYALFPL